MHWFNLKKNYQKSDKAILSDSKIAVGALNSYVICSNMVKLNEFVSEEVKKETNLQNRVL